MSKKRKKKQTKRTNSKDISPQKDVVIEKKSDKILKFFSFIVSLVSLIISFVSMNISCTLQKEANLFTQTMSTLNYDIDVLGYPTEIMYMDEKHTASPFIISKQKSKFSGDYKNFFIATVNNDTLDTFKINEKEYEDPNPDIRRGKFFNNDTMFVLYSKDLINNEGMKNLKEITGDKKIVEKLEDKNNISFFFMPAPKKNYSIFHIILNGYNGDKVLYSFICNYVEDKEASTYEFKTTELQCLSFDDDSLYDLDRIEGFTKNNQSLKLSSKRILDIIEKERNLIKEKIF